MRTKEKSRVKLSVSARVEELAKGSYWKGEFKQLPPNQTYTLRIDYPLGGNSVDFKIKTGKTGLDLIGLLKEIGKAYKKVYNWPLRYGVFGHDIEDLSLHMISINYKKNLIELGIDS